ncbi:MAG: nucleotidyltransferase domain-containing protein [Elusimicrobia bacterium]|nr:nucleotidyltransferase domain-containing protein [Elusimicrobiota bacterium]
MVKSQDVLVATNSQKVLNFLLDYPGEEFVEKEIREAVKISRSGTNYALKELLRAKFLFRTKKGKQYLYSLDYKNPIVKQVKVCKVIIQIQPLLQTFKKICSKVVLFGSSSRGEDVSDSDIDLFVISHNKHEIENTVNSFKSRRKIQVVIRSELKYTEMKKADPVFCKQIESGIVLWEGE